MRAAAARDAEILETHFGFQQFQYGLQQNICVRIGFNIET